MNTPLLISFFAAIFAILNPIGNLPVFVGVTSDLRPGVRTAMAVLIGGVICVSLVVFLFSGAAILRFFDISTPAFQIAGGILLLLMGLGMVRGEAHTLKKPAAAATPTGKKGIGEDFIEAESSLSKVLVPVAIPLFVGPGSMSTVVLYADKAGETSAATTNMIAMAVVLVIACAITTVILMASSWIARLLGHNGLEIATRVLGLIITAIGVQFILDGTAAVSTLFDATKLGA